jgi:hypothetical protein
VRRYLRRPDNAFVVEPRGMIDVKGKGEMETWWLIAPIKPATSTLIPS